MRQVSQRERSLPQTIIGKLLRLSEENKKVISLSIGEPDFYPPRKILRETHKIIQQYKKNRVTHYSAGQGIPELREAIVKKLLKDNKIKTSPDNVVVTAGSQEGLFAGFLCTLDPGDQVIVPSPGYLGYIPAIDLVNGIPKYLALKEEEKFAINPEELRKSITKKTEVIVLNSPANPTGTVLQKKIMEEIADVAVENDCYIFSDEAYEKIVYDGEKHTSIGSLNGMHDYVVTFHSFSKTYAMCGFRLGYLAGPKPLTEAIQKTIDYVTICAPHLSQLVGIKALHLPARHIEKMRREYDRRRRILVPRLNELGLPTHMPKGAFYAFANIQNTKMKSRIFTEKLLSEEKVAVVPGNEFGPHGEGFVRFSYAVQRKNIRKALERLEIFLKKRKVA